uniref:F-box domain-containing protein n=1 Tax=Lactuca sativa TaxID=4236 RepID=A0A9R1XF37_LACSA|nr:hypothetical protein LSAT_V11C400160790 [Lactuca sativa]
MRGGRSNSIKELTPLSKPPEINIVVVPEDDDVVGEQNFGKNNGRGLWSNLLPELLGETIKRVEMSDDGWPLRRNLVACGCVCKSWREVTREIVKPPIHSGKITFLSLHGAHMEYIISLNPDDSYQGSNAYVGKLRGPRRIVCSLTSTSTSPDQQINSLTLW